MRGKKDARRSIKIIIERKFKEGFTPEVLALLNKLRIKAIEQEGYISGETLVDLQDKPNKVLSTVWSSLDKWTSSPDRRRKEN